MSIFGEVEVIHTYTRQQAIEDGVLIDVTDTAKEAGIKFPVAVTRDVWALIEPTEALKRQGQSISGRLWDVLWMFRVFASRTKDNFLLYPVLFLLSDNGKFYTKEIKLKAVIGPGDKGEPVITIMMPYED